MVFYGLVFGFVWFALLIAIVNRHSRKAELKAKHSRNPYSSSVIKIPVATISVDLMPLMTPYAKGGITIKLVGSDGGYVTSRNGWNLLAGLEVMLREGASVEYYLTQRVEKNLRRYRDLHRDWPETFRIFILDDEACDDGVREVVSDLSLVHPTLVVDEYDPENKALWLEKYHPPGVDFAYDVIFVSRNAFDTRYSDLYNKFVGDLSLIRKSCSEWSENELHACG